MSVKKWTKHKKIHKTLVDVLVKEKIEKSYGNVLINGEELNYICDFNSILFHISNGQHLEKRIVNKLTHKVVTNII